MGFYLGWALVVGVALFIVITLVVNGIEVGAPKEAFGKGTTEDAVSGLKLVCPFH